MPDSATVKIEIAGRTERLKYSEKRFLYRTSLIGQPVDDAAFRDPVKQFAAIVNMIWALMQGSRYGTPEDLVEVLDLDQAPEYAEAVKRAVNLGTESDDSEKKSRRKTGRSGGSRSG